jgi:hypothetical protein
MSEEVSKKESKMSGEKWFWVGLVVWFIILTGSLIVHDMIENQCKVAAINKGMTATEVATACK